MPAAPQASRPATPTADVTASDVTASDVTATQGDPAPHHDGGRAGPSRRPAPLPVLTRWWFWVGLLLALWSIPLFKGLGAELPDPLPGMDSDALSLSLPDENGEQVALSEMRGNLVLITELPLANRAEAELTLERLWRLRKRMRGLGSGVIYASLAHGASPAELTDLLDATTARKPVNAFLVDEGRVAMDRLRREAGSQLADVFLLDRHGRVRGVYGRRPGEARLSEAEIDRLVAETGQLANWIGQDPAPERVDEVLGRS